MGVIEEFGAFLEQYKVMGLAIAFIIGSALTALTQSLVNNVIMPVVGIFLPKGDWQSATINLGSAVVGWGAFTAALIDFIILAFVVFLMAKAVSRGRGLSTKEQAKKKKRGG
jgi:large conductance mechanosensitive channel